MFVTYEIKTDWRTTLTLGLGVRTFKTTISQGNHTREIRDMLVTLHVNKRVLSITSVLNMTGTLAGAGAS